MNDREKNKEVIDNYIRNICQAEILKAKIEEIKTKQQLDSLYKRYNEIESKLQNKNNFNLFSFLKKILRKDEL